MSILVKRKQTRGMGSFGNMEISMLEGTILATFFPEAKDMTIKEISEWVDYSYERINSALKSLKEKKIVIEEQKGKTLVYSLNIDNLYSETIGFGSYMLQRKIDFIKKNKEIYQAIKEIESNQHIEGLILFGSYSKDTETKKSDVDIICFSNKKKETETFIHSLKHKFGINFSPIVMLSYEFSDIKKDNPELWNDLKLYGIEFKGDNFYYWMYKNDK